MSCHDDAPWIYNFHWSQFTKLLGPCPLANWSFAKTKNRIRSFLECILETVLNLQFQQPNYYFSSHHEVFLIPSQFQDRGRTARGARHHPPARRAAARCGGSDPPTQAVLFWDNRDNQNVLADFEAERRGKLAAEATHHHWSSGRLHGRYGRGATV